MEGTKMTPYRTAPTALEPIDEGLVPDCGRRETKDIRNKLKQIRDASIDNNWAREKRGLLRVWAASSICSIVASLILIATHALPGGVIAVICYCVFVLAGIVFFHRADDAHERFEHTPTLEEDALQNRLIRLASLEKMTGKGAHADKLSEEVATFNNLLKNLSETDCSSNDREIIYAKRLVLMRRIDAFHQQSLREP